MRWIAGLLAGGFVVVVAFYLLAVRDRSFRSYAGAELGMPLRTAIGHLKSNGYMVIHGPSEIRSRDCTRTDRYNLVYAADPTYSLLITPDRSCKVVQIARELGRMDL